LPRGGLDCGPHHGRRRARWQHAVGFFSGKVGWGGISSFWSDIGEDSLIHVDPLAVFGKISSLVDPTAEAFGFKERLIDGFSRFQVAG
jgi:hypothetical protein